MLGVLGAWFVSWSMSALPFGVPPGDPQTIAVAAWVLTALREG